MKYKLKKGQEAFAEVDGPFAGRGYRQGREYEEKDIPIDKLSRFEAKKTTKPKAIKPAVKTNEVSK